MILPKIKWDELSEQLQNEINHLADDPEICNDLNLSGLDKDGILLKFLENGVLDEIRDNCEFDIRLIDEEDCKTTKELYKMIDEIDELS